MACGERVNPSQRNTLFREGGVSTNCQKRRIFGKPGSIWEVNPAKSFPDPGSGTTGLRLCPKGLLHSLCPPLARHVKPYSPGKPIGW